MSFFQEKSVLSLFSSTSSNANKNPFSLVALGNDQERKENLFSKTVTNIFAKEILQVEEAQGTKICDLNWDTYKNPLEAAQNYFSNYNGCHKKFLMRVKNLVFSGPLLEMFKYFPRRARIEEITLKLKQFSVDDVQKSKDLAEAIALFIINQQILKTVVVTIEHKGVLKKKQESKKKKNIKIVKITDSLCAFVRELLSQIFEKLSEKTYCIIAVGGEIEVKLMGKKLKIIDVKKVAYPERGENLKRLSEAIMKGLDKQSKPNIEQLVIKFNKASDKTNDLNFSKFCLDYYFYFLKQYFIDEKSENKKYTVKCQSSIFTCDYLDTLKFCFSWLELDAEIITKACMILESLRKKFSFCELNFRSTRGPVDYAAWESLFKLFKESDILKISNNFTILLEDSDVNVFVLENLLKIIQERTEGFDFEKRKIIINCPLLSIVNMNQIKLDSSFVYSKITLKEAIGIMNNPIISKYNNISIQIGKSEMQQMDLILECIQKMHSLKQVHFLFEKFQVNMEYVSKCLEHVKPKIEDLSLAWKEGSSLLNRSSARGILEELVSLKRLSLEVPDLKENEVEVLLSKMTSLEYLKLDFKNKGVNMDILVNVFFSMKEYQTKFEIDQDSINRFYRFQQFYYDHGEKKIKKRELIIPEESSSWLSSYSTNTHTEYPLLHTLKIRLEASITRKLFTTSNSLFASPKIFSTLRIIYIRIFEAKEGYFPFSLEDFRQLFANLNTSNEMVSVDIFLESPNSLTILSHLRSRLFFEFISKQRFLTNFRIQKYFEVSFDHKRYNQTNKNDQNMSIVTQIIQVRWRLLCNSKVIGKKLNLFKRREIRNSILEMFI